MENFPHAMRKFSLKTGGTIESKLIKIAKEKSSSFAIDDCLEKLNVKIEYQKEKTDPVKFAEMRKKLKTEAGLVIGNHPGHLDSLLILRALEERKDFKIFIHGARMESFSSTLGKENLISSFDSMGIRKIIKSIQQGYIVLLFPVDAFKERKKEEISFRQGFASIINKLDPEKMVYCFHFNQQDLQSTFGKGDWDEPNFKRDLKTTGVYLEYLLQNKIVNLNRYQKKHLIRVDEQYTQANQWQNLPREKRKKPLPDSQENDYDNASSEYYKSLFELT